MVGLAGLGKQEWILLIIILSLPISWNNVKLSMVNLAKFDAWVLQLLPSNNWGPSPALHMKFTSTGGNSE